MKITNELAVFISTIFLICFSTYSFGAESTPGLDEQLTMPSEQNQQNSDGDDNQQNSDGDDNQQNSDGDDNRQNSDGDDNEQNSDGDGSQQNSDGDGNEQNSDGDGNQQNSNGYNNQQNSDEYNNLTAELRRRQKIGYLFRPYRENYLLPYTSYWQDHTADNLGVKRQRTETKFQLSILAKVVDFAGYSFDMFFTQRSFWQIGYLKYSRPFRESNFNPGLLIRTPDYSISKNTHLRFDLIGEHQSNGQVEPISRSWNRAAIAPALLYGDLYLEYKLWYRLPEEEKEYPNDPKGDENPDIEKYLGYGELFLTYTDEIFYFSLLSRMNPSYGHYAIEANFSIRVTNGLGPRIMFQVFDGYGESLIDYNRKITKVGVGLLFGI